jgi:hypothetical protein
MLDFCEHGSKLLGSIKCRDIEELVASSVGLCTMTLVLRACDEYVHS